MSGLALTEHRLSAIATVTGNLDEVYTHAMHAVDEGRSELVAMWDTGHGAVVMPVATLPTGAGSRHRLALAAELNGLSEALWRCYTHPASAAASLDVNTEGWRRQQTRDGFDAIAGYVREPNPDEHGSLIVSYDPVVEWANRVVGRCTPPRTRP